MTVILITHNLYIQIPIELAVVLVFYLVAGARKVSRWSNFGIGRGIGVLTHILLDLLVWFNGVPLSWPIRYELNLWSGFSTPRC